MNRTRYGWALVLLVGCGSASPEPKAPASEPAPAPASEKSSEPSEKPSAEAPAPDKAESSEPKTAESLSPADLGTVLQAMLNDPELDSYLHTEKPGRTPLKLSGPDLPKDLKLVKGTHVVSIVDGPKSPKDPVLVLTKIGLEGNIATIAYRYDVERIRGTTRVKNGKSGWELMSSRFVEPP